MSKNFDVAIVGAGIVGLSHAWMAAERGLNVVVLERTSQAEGASIRNFGMIWPIGQPVGEPRECALRSRQRWLALGEQGVLPVHTCGSIHLAHQPDELAVLEEFCDQTPGVSSMLTRDEVLQKSPRANPNRLLGGMWSDSELRVNPRHASAKIAAWLTEKHGVEFRFQTPVVHIETSGNGQRVQCADAAIMHAGRVFVCSGSDLKTLYPATFAESGLKLCKLQMLKTTPQPQLLQTAPHLASGLTLRHYASFETCPSLSALKARIQSDSPRLDEFGIHVMASEFPNGEIILGDSHEYGDAITPFDNSTIDDLILSELRKVLRLENWTIAERWHGVYAKHPSQTMFTARPAEGVNVYTGTGGAGMTMSFGLAEQVWSELDC